MIVREMIEQLQAMPPDALVVVPGYETGMTEARPPAVHRVIPEREPESWEGEWEPSRGEEGVEVVYIGGARHDAI
jgi:hypothetical protein